jgi:TPR repeat protein
VRTAQNVQPEPDAQTLAADLAAQDFDTFDLARIMETDPESVAAALNAIEPVTGDAAGVIQSAVQEQGMAVEDSGDAAQTGGAQEAAFVQPSETSSQSNAEDLEDVSVSGIEADDSLPAIIKEIEAQAMAGIATAQHDLAAIYTAGHGGAVQNFDRAAFWFEKAAEQGIANARYNLGVLYHQGLGTARDIDRAIDWYSQAAAQGHPEASYNLGIAHIEGIGVAYEPALAAEYFERAAEQGITEAAYNLGLIHENGLLGAPSPEEAILWYKMASDSGSAEARLAMEQLASTLNLDPEEIDALVGSARAARLESPDITPSPGMLARTVQKYLMVSGLFPGPANGVIGQQTQDAIRAYQARNGLGVDGQVSEALLTHMQAVDTPEGEGELGSRAE